MCSFNSQVCMMCEQQTVVAIFFVPHPSSTHGLPDEIWDYVDPHLQRDYFSPPSSPLPQETHHELLLSCRKQDIALFLPTMVGSPPGVPSLSSSSSSSWSAAVAGGSAEELTAPTPTPVFLAFHVNCPNRYLSEESVNNARQALGASPAYILGRIILVEQHVATEVGSQGSEGCGSWASGVTGAMGDRGIGST